MANNNPAPEPSPAQVRAQRDRILASKLFTLSKRLKEFLGFIIDTTLDGRADRLKEFTLGIEVFEKGDTFDPNLDSIVRVEASRLRSKLREYYDREGKNDPVRIEIPKGHYVPIFRLVGRDPESEGTKNELDVDRSRLTTDVTGRKIGLTLIAVMAVAIVFFIVDKLTSVSIPIVPVREIHDRSIAVLPFVSMSSGEDDGYFADGLTEEILNSLAQLPQLQVTARTSSFFFKGKNLPVPDIASTLGVASIVEGSIRRDGDRLRIAVQVIRASDDVHLWSQSFDRTRNDVFAVQEEIAEKIAEVLGVVLDDATRDVMHSAGIHDVEAFIAYQKGQEAFMRAHRGMNMSDALTIANEYFDLALEAAPGLTTARLMKADLRGHILLEIIADLRDEKYAGELSETLAALREEYRLAVEQSPAGHQRDLLELERTLFSDDWKILPARIGKAIRVGECGQMNWTNAFISPLGWAGQLSTMYQEAVACNPLDIVTSFHLASALIWSGDSEAALLVIADAENKGLSHPFLDDARFWALLATGRVDDPATHGPGTGGGNMPYDRRILREALAGDPEVARQMAEDYWSDPGANDFSSLLVAAVVGDRKKANDVVARIDALPGSAVVLSSAIVTCFCGAPFDLDAAPNYQARIDEAGLPWPPPTRIDYPTKPW